ncbi:MAG: fumarylacetoacetate hydrolase family protein [Pseudomonadota bacterium]
MKFLSFTRDGRASYGVLLAQDQLADLGASLPQHADLRSAIEALQLHGLLERAQTLKPSLVLKDVQLLPPVPHPQKIICVGLNYRAHAAEGGFKVPVFPSTFIRLQDTLVASGGAIVMPGMSSQLDFEGELAIVIGKGGREISAADALTHVFGYACFNDGSLRDIQFGHSLAAGKNFPSTGGFGPFITSADDIPDPSLLTLTTRLNGATVQQQSLDDMIFDVPAIIEYVSSWTPLSPGDVIATGTPAGVGFARKPPLWMKPGDVIEVEISKLGVLRNVVTAA